MLTTAEQAAPSRSPARDATRERLAAAAVPARAPFREQTAVLHCGADALHAVVTVPEATAASGSGVVIVVGGPQYRAGSHRQFVLLARALAAAGFAVLRFDCRGMGDSAGEPRGFDGIDEDIAAAVDGLLREVPAVRRVVLWGLCDGASAALLYCHARNDRRVAGLCLVNPWVRSEVGLARAHVRHYYARRVLQRDFWAKLLRGGVATRALAEFLRSVRSALAGTAPSASAGAVTRASPFRDRMAAAWQRFDGDVLLLLSGRDLTALEFLEHARVDPAWLGVIESPRTVRHDLADADHTFSAAAARAALQAIVVGWLRRREGIDGA